MTIVALWFTVTSSINCGELFLFDILCTWGHEQMGGLIDASAHSIKDQMKILTDLNVQTAIITGEVECVR